MRRGDRLVQPIEQRSRGDVELAAFEHDEIGNMAQPVPAVAADLSCAALYESFSREPDLVVVPVVEDGRPLGLINRYEFCLRLADKFGRALFEKKPVSQLMDPSSLIVDARMRLDDLGPIILNDRPSAISNGFIIADSGAYIGVGTAFSMLRMRVDVSQRRARELEIARAMAESANKAKSDFLANMSHELRTPLNAVIGFSDLILQESFGPIGDSRYEEYVGDIHRSGTHLLRLVNNILDLSKIEAGRFELDVERVSLIDTIQMAVRMTGERAQAAGVDIKILLADEIGEIDADRTKLLQVFLNLLSNAVKFTPGGGRVQVTGRRNDDGSVLVEVRDSGIGMTPDEVKVALEPFGQVESGLARRFDGTGLGLPLTKSIVELHGGGVEIQSRKGSGTRVAVRVPARQPARDMEVAARVLSSPLSA